MGTTRRSNNFRKGQRTGLWPLCCGLSTLQYALDDMSRDMGYPGEYPGRAHAAIEKCPLRNHRRHAYRVGGMAEKHWRSPSSKWPGS